MATRKYSNFATYGAISVQGNSTAETTTDATPRKIVAFDTDGLFNNMTVNAADGSILPAETGKFKVTFSGSFSGSASKEFVVELYNNGVATGFDVVRVLGTGGDVGSVSVTGIFEVTAGEKVTAFHHSTDGGSAFTLESGSLVIERVA